MLSVFVSMASLQVAVSVSAGHGGESRKWPTSSRPREMFAVAGNGSKCPEVIHAVVNLAKPCFLLLSLVLYDTKTPRLLSGSSARGRGDILRHLFVRFAANARCRRLKAPPGLKRPSRRFHQKKSDRNESCCCCHLPRGDVLG